MSMNVKESDMQSRVTLSPLLHLSERCWNSNWTHLSSTKCPHSPSSLRSPRSSLSAPWLGLFLSPRSVTFRSCHVINTADSISLWPKQEVSRMSRGPRPLTILCVSPHQVSHVLNVAYGVPNLYPDLFVYKTLQILDLPDTDIISYLADCSSFIDEARKQVQFTHARTAELVF